MIKIPIVLSMVFMLHLLVAKKMDYKLKYQMFNSKTVVNLKNHVTVLTLIEIQTYQLHISRIVQQQIHMLNSYQYLPPII